MTRDEIVTALRCCAEGECYGCTIHNANQHAAINDTLYDSNAKLAADRKVLKNELCQYCGKYKQAHKGACDGCRWKQ